MSEQTKHIKMFGTRSCLHLDIILKMAHCIQKVADPCARVLYSINSNIAKKQVVKASFVLSRKVSEVLPRIEHVSNFQQVIYQIILTSLDSLLTI